jgi:PAS domain S-box-containing protein
MHALTQVVHLPSLDSVIDFSPLTVTPDTSLLDVVTQMSRQQASSVLVVENLTTDGLQVVGWFTQQDAIALLSRGFDFRTAKVSQVMVTPVITLNYFEVKSITFILFTLRKYKLPMLPIVAERGQLIGIVTLDTIYQALQILPCSFVEGETVGVAVLKDKQQPKLSSNVNCTEERLRLLESAVVNANDAIVIAAADALDEPLGPQIIYVNEAFTRMSGWSATEVIGKTPRILQGELTDRVQLDRIRAALQDGLPIRAELINYHKNGSTYWVEVNIVPIADRKGKLTHFVSVQRDITKRKLTEEALRASEALLREVTENIRQVLFVRDIKQNKIVYVTPAYEDIWGRSCASLYENSLDFLEAIHPLDRDRVIAGMKSQAAGKNYNEEYRIVRPDGEVRWICTRAFPLQNELGEVYRVVGISEDISELKQAQAALKQANAELEKRVEERTQALQQINRQLRHEISDRKQAEAALRQTQQQLQAILDNCPAIVYVVDTQNRFLLINRQYEKVFHCTKQQITGKSIYDFFNSEFADIFAVNNQNVLTSGKSVEAEEIAPQEDGLHTYFSVKFALKDANGVPYAICGISTDITDRKHANESLVRFRTAIESSSDAIGMADIGGEVIYVNPAFVELFEYTLAELQVAGGPPVLYINKAECKEIFATVENSQSWRGEVKMQTKRGQILDIDLRADAIKDATGKIIGTVGIHTDITERKRVEERLRLRDRAIAASSNGIVISDARLPNLPIIYANPAFEYITGYSLEEVIGRNCRFLQGADTNQPEIKELSIAIRQARNCTVILRNYRKDGSLFWNELSVSPVFDTDGNCTHYVGIQNDITERMQAEEELRTALEKEKELNELKSRVVTMISHEFRTPLSTILSSSELLEHYRHKWAEEKQLSHVHRIQVAVKHMTNMLNDVLVIGKAEVGKLDFKPVPLDLVEYCRYLVEELQFDINTQDAIAFSCEYESIPCCMDEKLLGYILRNLLSNAIKYSPNGSTVKFSLTCREERAILEIQDQGIGIPQEDLPYLFESFHRATNVGNIQGTGLGLTIVKKCTDLHQGEIFVTSEVGIGTKFTVALPLKNG